MKAFIVGLFFIICAAILTIVGILLLPFLLALAFFLRIIVMGLLVVFSIWLLGKLVIYVWEQVIR